MSKTGTGWFERRMGPALVMLLLACAAPNGSGTPSPLDTPPSALPLADYETQVLYPWLHARGYADPELGWTVDSRVRDTGPFIRTDNYGTHPAVRIYYSPGVREWLDDGREGPIPAGGMIIKEMFKAPAAIYETLRQDPWFVAHPDQYEQLLAELLSAWAVMINDPAGNAIDGWFWSSPGNAATLEAMLDPAAGNVDNYSHVLTSAFGIGTCSRCHSSAESENTFSSVTNFDPNESPLQFRVDESWRSADYLGSVYTTIEDFLKKQQVPEADAQALLLKLDLPPQQRPYQPPAPATTKPVPLVDPHKPAPDDPTCGPLPAPPTPALNPAFVAQFADLTHLAGQDLSAAQIKNFSFPCQFADHVPPTPDIHAGGLYNPNQYLTSSNCYGCHGGLGGAPYGVNMFIQTGPRAGTGYNVSEYGEWRWSPMGLAGRDPVFHSQLETEQIILLKENGKLKDGQPAGGDLAATQQALTDTCLRCHGAMGLRQKGIDQGGDILNPHFDVNFFYLAEPLTVAEQTNPPFKPPANEVNPPSGLTPEQFYSSYDLGDLAREGISCLVCHHIAPPDPNAASAWVASHPDWFGTGPVWSDSFFFFLGTNTTGLYTRNPANEVYGPFADVLEKPMQNGIGITPKVAPPMDGDTPFTSDSAMCGTCHTINLPNIGAPPDQNPVLTALEPNPYFQKYSHSIEQATYLEWLNSSFGLGAENEEGPKFQSCQDCHMPNRFASRDGKVDIPQLASQIASIQDATYPQAEHQLPSAELDVPVRADYARHELVGLNAFVVEMFRQFPDILGVSAKDYETDNSTGPNLAVESMLLSIEENRVATLQVNSAEVTDEAVEAELTVTNQTGHRFPSGVTFRRAFIEFQVLDEADKVLWASGQTNPAGVIVGADGKPLPTEFLDQKANPDDKIAQYQPNHQVITDQSQVQIYEELITNAEDEFTTSFIHRVDHIKDNRLLPEGWIDAAAFAGKSPGAGIADQGELLFEFMESTNPEGPSVIGGVDPNGQEFPPDPNYVQSPSPGWDQVRYAIPLKDLAGKPASVQATLYSQSLMPAWFHQRFSLANEAKAAGYATPETDRLWHIASRLNLDGTKMAGWKLEVAKARQTLSP